MNKIYFIFIFLISFAGTAQQNDQEQILADSKSFVSALEKKDYEHFLDLIYPRIYEVIDRETFLEAVKGIYEGNEDFSIKITNLDKTQFTTSEIFTDVAHTKYAFVNYPISMEMTFLNDSFESEEEKMMLKNIMELQGMKIEFVNDYTITAQMQSMTIAINDEVTGNTWKYLNHEEDNQLSSRLISSEILSRANDYYEEFILKQK